MSEVESEKAGGSGGGGPEVSNTPQPQAAPRESLITTAVKFLQNPKVRESAFEQRRAFLDKKGLTKAEIDIAIARSGTAQDEHAPPAAGAQAAPPGGVAVQQPGYPAAPYPHQVQVYQPPPPSNWQRVRDVVSTAVFIGGISYAVYQFLRRYLAPHWFGPSREEKRMAAVQKNVEELQKSIAEMLSSMKETQETLRTQRDHITDMAQSAAASRGSGELSKIRDEQNATDIKEEIRSLKGLLLSRKQFPTLPNSKPVLPAWQLAETSKTDLKDAPADIKDAPTDLKDTPADIKDAPSDIKDTPADIKDAPADVTDVAEKLKENGESSSSLNGVHSGDEEGSGSSSHTKQTTAKAYEEPSKVKAVSFGGEEVTVEVNGDAS